MIRLLLLGLVAMIALAAFAASTGRGADAPELRIRVMQAGETNLHVTYEWRKAQREARFLGIDGGYRERRWSVETDGFEIETGEEFDIIRARDGGKFQSLSIIARPELVRLDKEYQPVSRYGAGGVLIYTGHFWPMAAASARDGDERADATFDFTPAAGGEVVAFGDRAARLENWRSPEAHPAFVYMGPLAPVETDDVMALIDPDAPAWIVDEFNMLVPRAFASLSALFEFQLETKPNLFLSAMLDGGPGRLSYAGDALPAQFQIMLRGGAWTKPNEKARGVFRRSTVHEAVHLWQAAARPADEGAPEWIHEGAADAIAAEVLVALGAWDAAAFDRNFATARGECAGELEKGALNGASARRDFRALYACGQVIADAVARADGASTASFWRALIRRARKDGYTEAMFYALIEDRTGDADFAKAVRHFARTPLAEPQKEIDALLAAARAAANSGAGL